MNKSFILIVIAVVAIVAGGFYYWYSNQDAIYSSQPENVSAASTSTVIYTDSGFSPSMITIAKGGTIIFKNMAPYDMWVGSAMHPTHAVYPTTGGCIASTFDSCRGIASGGSWSFKFDIAGTWGYHDHLNPSKFGKVVVQ